MAASRAAAKHPRGPRLSADERRAEVLQAATAAFARGGYAGTSTEDIAGRAGISQPYLFRLFGTKRELFLATAGVMHQRIEDTFGAAAEGLRGIEAMKAMGEAYKALLEERDLLLVQLHLYAASEDEEIRAFARAGFRRLWRLVEALTGLPSRMIRGFFAQGMLMNVMAGIDAAALDEDWAQAACSVSPEEFFLLGVEHRP